MNKILSILLLASVAQMEGSFLLPASPCRIDALDRRERARARVGVERWVFEACRKDIFTPFNRPSKRDGTYHCSWDRHRS